LKDRPERPHCEFPPRYELARRREKPFHRFELEWIWKDADIGPPWQLIPDLDLRRVPFTYALSHCRVNCAFLFRREIDCRKGYPLNWVRRLCLTLELHWAPADVAIESAGITLLKGDLGDIVQARRLSQATMRNIRQNLLFAFIYNAAGVPIAAGVLYPVFGLLLSPIIAAAAMALSSVSVIGNELRLRTVRL
jgi:hypothetical protein